MEEGQRGKKITQHEGLTKPSWGKDCHGEGEYKRRPV